MVAVVIATVVASAQPAAGFRAPVESVESGVIMDVSPTRVLYRDPDNTPNAGLHIKDRVTGAVEDITPVPNRFPVKGFLSPHGAIFIAGLDALQNGIHEWRDGALLNHGVSAGPSAFLVAGDYAVWSEIIGPCCGDFRLYRRDLAAGTTIEVATDAGNNDTVVLANGDVYYFRYPDPEIFRWRDGVAEQLTDDAYWNLWPVADGVNVAYRKAVPNPVGGGDETAALLTPGGEILLDDFRPYDAPGPLYDVAGGWTAFTRVGADGRSQLWRRNPAGTVSQVSPTGLDNVGILGLNGSGETWFSSSVTHFFARASGAPLDMGDNFWPATRSRGQGNFLFIEGGRWFAAYGDTIYELSTGYPRPRGATPARFALVTAYDPCQSPNRVHGPPLAFESCSPPAKSSPHLTVGTGDSNGKPAKSNGHVLIATVVGNPATPADEADLRIEVEITDVYRADNLQDYAGELRLDGSLRIVDRNTQATGGGTTHGTVVDVGFPFDVPCNPTADPTVGATCSLTTTMNAGGPFIKEGARAIWQIEEVKVFDGGPDGDADTADNTLFAVPGVFIP